MTGAAGCPEPKEPRVNLVRGCEPCQWHLRDFLEDGVLPSVSLRRWPASVDGYNRGLPTLSPLYCDRVELKPSVYGLFCVSDWLRRREAPFEQKLLLGNVVYWHPPLLTLGNPNPAFQFELLEKHEGAGGVTCALF